VEQRDMSTPAFLALSLLCGGALIALLLIIVKLVGGPLAKAHRRWLEGRLSRRLARGSDRYFEELRSLETALADGSVAPAPRERGPLNLALIVLFSVVFGMQILIWNMSKPQRPGWTEHVGATIFIVIGAQWAAGASNFSGTPTRGSRALGIAVMALFSFFLLHDLSRHY
jgi:hypothetical protein